MKIVEHYIPYTQTNAFSLLVYDYLEENKGLQTYIENFPNTESLRAQLALKSTQPLQRSILVEALRKQYAGIEMGEAVARNLDALQSTSTFTICTAHQPLIFTGHVYFIYKIVQTILLAKHAKSLFPKKHFVPVFYLGSEDHDIDEIGHLVYNGKTYSWQPNQKGACGRMSTSTLVRIATEIIASLDMQKEDEKWMIELLQESYNGTNTLAEATRIFVHALWKEEGIVIIDGDDKALKQLFVSVMQHELLYAETESVVMESKQQLTNRYKVDATPRVINLFYLKDEIRERIEREGEVWKVMNTTIQFTKEELVEELHHFPERFSPNFVLRPMYQETILPNVMVVGGGGELAYWLLLKNGFSLHGIVYPLFVLRNSVAWILKEGNEIRKSLALDWDALFLSSADLYTRYRKEDSRLDELDVQLQSLEEHYLEIEKLGQQYSVSMAKSMQAHHAKANKVHKRIKEKWNTAIRKEDEIILRRIDQWRAHLFPNGQLQERHANFLTYYKVMGKQFFSALHKHQIPLGKEFLILQIEE